MFTWRSYLGRALQPFSERLRWGGNIVRPVSSFSLASLGASLLVHFDAAQNALNDGATLADSAGSNDATLTVGGGDTPASKHTLDYPAALEGIVTGSISLDGTDDYGETQGNSGISGGAQDVTLSFWAKLNTNAASQTVVALGAWSFVNALVLRTYYGYDGQNFGYLWAAATNGQDLNTTVMADTNWHHHCLRITRSNTTLEYFRDGVSQGTVGVSTNFTAAPLRIGKRCADAAEYADANVTDIRLWASGLDDTTIGQLADGVDYTTGVLLHLTCDDGQGPCGDGDRVASWQSAEGNAYELAQSDNDLRPTWVAEVAGLNSLPALQFSGTQILEIAQTLVAQTSGEVYVVYYPTAAGDAYQTLLSQSDEATTNHFWRIDGRGNNANGHPNVVWQNGGTADTLDADGPIAAATAYLLVVRSDGSATTMELNTVAQTIAADTGSNQGNWLGDLTGADNFTVGAKKDSGGVSLGATAYVAEVLITTTLSASHRSGLSNLLLDKYAIGTSGAELLTNHYAGRFGNYGQSISADGRTAVLDLLTTIATVGATLRRGWLPGTAVNLTAAAGRMLELTQAEQDFVHMDTVDSTLTVTGGALTITGDTLNKGYLTANEQVLDNTDWTLLLCMNTCTRDSQVGTTEDHHLLSQYLSGASNGDWAFFSSGETCGVIFTCVGASPEQISIHNAGLGPMQPIVIWLTYDATTRVLTIYDAFTGATVGTTTLAAGGFSARDTRFGIAESGGYPRISMFLGMLQFDGVRDATDRDAIFHGTNGAWDVLTRFNNQVLVYGNSVTSGSDASKISESWTAQLKVWGCTNNCVIWQPGGMGSKSYYHYRADDYELPPARAAMLGALDTPLTAAQITNYTDKRIHILVLDDNQNIVGGTGIAGNPTAVEYQDLQHIVGSFITALQAGDSGLQVVSGTCMAVRAVEVDPPHDPLTFAQVAASYWHNNLRDWSADIRADAAYDAVYDLYADLNLGWAVGDDGDAEDPVNDLPKGDPLLFYDDAQHPNDDGHALLYTGYTTAIDSVRRT